MRIGVSLLVSLFALTCVVQMPAFTADSMEPPRKILTGKLDYLQSLCGSVGIALEDGELPKKITKVKLGTPAALSGIRQGDMIIDFKVDGGTFTLRIEREGKKFEVPLAINMRALRAIEEQTSKQTALAAKAARINAVASIKVPAPNLTAQTGTTDNTKTSSTQTASISETTLKPSVEERRSSEPPTDRELLESRQIILVVDKSGSMASKDDACNGKTRFEWCQSAVLGLANEPELKNQTFTLIFFNTAVDVIRDCDARVVERMFTLSSPDGGTDLASALISALQTRKARPAVIAVLHDGVSNVDEIDDVVIAATHKFPTPGDLAFTFLQIGEDRKGAATLHHLDTKLVGLGAKFDVVDTIPFSVLRAMGLKAALVHAIKHSGATRTSP
jgi:Mg-chelatase subunit ChlD